MPMTNFSPAEHGFKFNNQFVNDFIPALDYRTGGLCGGMSYAALDYYNTHVPIPTQRFRPANGTVLHSYLYDRQTDSITNNLPAWGAMGYNPFGQSDTYLFNLGISAAPGSISGGLVGGIDGFKQFVDQGIPAVLGLQGDGSTGNHQVIAIGYDMGRYKGDLGAHVEDFKIFICDPNYPGIVRTLIPNLGRQIYQYQEGGAETWRTYFVDENYSVHQPPAIPNANYPQDGMVYELILPFVTGPDDLRGGSIVNLVVNLMDGTQQTYGSINLGSRWVSNNEETAEVILLAPILESQIKNLVISTNFSGGVDGDNWDMNSLVVNVLGGELYSQIRQVAFKRFTGDDKTLTVRIAHTLRDIAQILNIYTLRGILSKLRELFPDDTRPFTLRNARESFRSHFLPA